MALADTTHDEADEFRSATPDHSMIIRLGEGSPDEEPFYYWVWQNYAYLIEYSRLFTLGAAKAPTLDSMGVSTNLLGSAVDEEMGLHRSYTAEFDIDTDELKATTPPSTTRAYTDFLARTAALGSFGDTVVALLPCMWGFNEMGRRLTDAGVPDYDQYVAWVGIYAGDEFTELTDRCKALVDDVVAGAIEPDRERYHDLFRTSTQYEYPFWDVVWRQEEQPL